MAGRGMAGSWRTQLRDIVHEKCKVRDRDSRGMWGKVGVALIIQPDEDLCAQRGCRQVPFLVLPPSAQEGQEGVR